jgi:hypothetical protein
MQPKVRRHNTRRLHISCDMRMHKARSLRYAAKGTVEMTGHMPSSAFYLMEAAGEEETILT